MHLGDDPVAGGSPTHSHTGTRGLVPPRVADSTVDRVIDHIGAFVQTFRPAFSNLALRRVEIASFSFNMAESGTWIAILVFAYSVGGATAVGIIGVVQLVPATLFAPVAATLGDRYRRDRVLLASYLAQAGAIGLTGAALLAHAPLIVIYPLAALAATMETMTRPVQGALLPSLAESPQELIAANGAIGWIEGVSLFLGPIATGILLAVSSPGMAFVVAAAGLVCGAVLVARVTGNHLVLPVESQAGASSVVAELREGFDGLVEDRHSILVVSLMSVNFVVMGALDLLLVILAIMSLHTGNTGVAFLNAAFGVGMLLGAGVTVALVSRGWLAPALLIGTAAWSVALGVVDLSPSRILAPILLSLAGIGRQLIDVSGRILLQRMVQDRVLSRVLGVVEGLTMGSSALGIAIAPVLVSLLGIRSAFIAMAATFPGLMLFAWRRLASIGAVHAVPGAPVSLLRSLALFVPLSVPVIERLAGRLHSIAVGPDSVVIHQGAPGDRFYIIAAGTFDVSVDGRSVATLKAHDFFGEIALLKSIPRTASVTSTSIAQLYALDREDFLEAVTGHPASVLAADTVSASRLAEQRL